MKVATVAPTLPDIPASLRLDGAPPLYYLLLNGWMSLFGNSEVATHTLSLLFALAVVPTALWAGWSPLRASNGLGVRRPGRLNPFLATYANETRMYTLVALLVMVATASSSTPSSGATVATSRSSSSPHVAPLHPQLGNLHRRCGRGCGDPLRPRRG
jgi:hypothetical protein